MGESFKTLKGGNEVATPGKSATSSKTIAINVLAFIVGVTSYVELLPLSSEAKSAVIAGLAVAGIVLRYLTKQPIK
jgi:hypothetical protein